MTDRRKPRGGDYEVGYGKPPRHSQFVPGQSGNKGRRKRPETPAEIVARIRDELVTVNGRAMTKFELAVHATVNQTIKGGKPRDLKLLFELLDKHGAIPAADWAADMKKGADQVMDKIFTVFNRTLEIDPADSAMIARLEAEEAQLILKCTSCSEALRSRWKDPDYMALAKRHGPTRLHDMVEKARKAPSNKE
jgi:hypothetical protein